MKDETHNVCHIFATIFMTRSYDKLFSYGEGERRTPSL